MQMMGRASTRQDVTQGGAHQLPRQYREKLAMAMHNCPFAFRGKGAEGPTGEAFTELRPAST